MEKIIRGLSRILAIFSAIAIVIMVIAIVIDVIERNTTGASMPGMIEVAETAMVTTVAFGLAWAAVQGEHVAVTILTDRFSPGLVKVINVFVWLVSSIYVGYLVYATYLRAMASTRSGEVRFGIVQWPMYPMRWILFTGFVSLLLVTLLNLYRSLRGHEPLGFADEVEAALAEQEGIKEDQPETVAVSTVSPAETLNTTAQNASTDNEQDGDR